MEALRLAAARPLRNPVLHVSGVALSLLGVLLLSFVAHLALLSGLRYERAQVTAYADLRTDLANAVVPVGQTTFDDRLVAPGTAVAVLRIPALDQQVVVFEGTTSDVLALGPGHRRDTVLPGQAGISVIMGRRATYGAPFADLGQLDVGDDIYTITGQGNSFTEGEEDKEHRYRVISVRRAGDPVLQPAEVAAGRLTLVTADGPVFLPLDVLRVDAELVGPAEPTPGRLDLAALSAAEQAMGTDRDAWVPVVFWGQALVLAAFAVTWARIRWGFWQAWIIGLPVLGALGLATADEVARLFPNLM